ncbi:acyl-CoA dehydrogenase family protein [Mycolicibacterium smegmatis]|uniref:Acyl-CoA dehydrogenase n=1 Tax=Mycolicibacterium smegmatis (strain MKD8) TaxID=1214915 RepID=A0A2U9PIP3_MYCSE|nr:acyl-CoA dehydrogenase family protein [Mycolicibacterium smegmatis]AWT51593.1 acyl-CoA dehydrogenase [Mycolicibacterium smegmatis MKD8]
MSSSRQWWGPALDDDARGLRDMLDEFVDAHELALTDDAAAVAALVGELAGLGIWTLGTAETCGGGGADRTLTTVAFERLGRAWPALGWAAVQAHTAVDVLAGDDRFADLVAALHTGDAAVAVVDAQSLHVRLQRDGAAITGTVDRVDVAAEEPHLLVLFDDGTAALIEPPMVAQNPLRRTGFGGALTRSLDVDAPAAHVVGGVDVDAAQVRLRLGAAAVAAGIAGAAADAAVAYASDRRQFGDTLTAIPTVRKSLMEQTSRAVLILGAVLGGAEDPIQAASVALHALDGAIDVAAGALQSHGGYGYLVEYDAERRLRDAVSLRAAADIRGQAITTARTLAGVAPAGTSAKD